MSPFWGSPPGPLDQAHEPPLSMQLGPVLLAGLGVALGLWPLLANGVIQAATIAGASQPGPLPLAIWHGWSKVLALSLVTLAGGLALYVAVGPLRRVGRHLAGVQLGHG